MLALVAHVVVWNLNEHNAGSFFLCVTPMLIRFSSIDSSVIRIQSTYKFSYLCLGAVCSARVQTQTYAETISSACQYSRSNG